MSKRLLILVGCLMALVGVNAQVNFEVESKNVARGERFTINCTVENFVDVVGVEMYVAWNPGVLRPVRLVNSNDIEFTDEVFSINEDEGRFTLQWFDPDQDLAGVSLTDGSNFWTLEFEAIGADGSSSDVEILENAGEFRNTSVRQTVNGNIVRAETNFTAGTVMIGDAPASSVTFEVGDASTMQNEIITLPVSVQAFDSITGVQFALSWDETALEFVDVQSINLEGLSISAFGTSRTSEGIMTMQWTSPGANPITVADDTELFEVRFRVLARAGTEQVSFVDDGDFTRQVRGAGPNGSISTPRLFIGNEGTVTITTSGGGGGGDCEGSGIIFYLSEEEAPNGEQVCVTFQADNYADALGIQVTFEWDSEVIAFSDLNQIEDLGTEMRNLVGQNRLVYTGISDNAISLADGGILFEICFNVVGEEGETSSIRAFVDAADGVFGSNNTDLEYTICPGSVTVGSSFEIEVDTLSPSCQEDEDGRIMIELPNASSYTYSWSTGGAEIATTQNLDNIGVGTYSLVIRDQNNAVVYEQDVVISHPNPIVVNSFNTVASTDGSDGAIQLQVSGGQGGLSYLWSNGATTQNISGLGAGTYTVIITDGNNCTLMASYEVTGVFGGLQVNVTTSNYNGFGVSCNGAADGSIVVGGQGGTTPYTYEWIDGASGGSNELNGLSAGQYTIRVRDADGTEITQMIELTQPDALMLDPNVVADSDNNGSGSIDLRPSGGVRPYTFSWDTPNNDSQAFVRNLSSGTYTVTVRDANNCQLTDRIFVPGDLDCFADVVITPNEDGLNDRLAFNCIEQFEEVNLKIFDQWGGMVFESTGYSNDWRATTVGGEQLADGAYFYAVQVRDDQGNYSLFKGSITVIHQLR